MGRTIIESFPDSYDFDQLRYIDFREVWLLSEFVGVLGASELGRAPFKTMERHEILDRDHLARYTLGDAELEQEVLGLFIGQMPETLAVLRESDDAVAWTRAAHTIKGSARVVGAWKLASAAERAEGCSGRFEHWGQLADDIEAAVAEVRLQISQLAEPR